MKREIVFLMIGVFVAVGAAGCRKGEDQAGKAPQTSGPLEGGKVVGPITVKFLGFEDRGGEDQRGAKFLIRNSSGKRLQMINLTLRYLDQDGNQIGTYFWGTAGVPAFLEPGQTTTEIIGAGIPKNCASVDIVVKDYR